MQRTRAELEEFSSFLFSTSIVRALLSMFLFHLLNSKDTVHWKSDSLFTKLLLNTHSSGGRGDAVLPPRKGDILFFCFVHCRALGYETGLNAVEPKTRCSIGNSSNTANDLARSNSTSVGQTLGTVAVPPNRAVSLTHPRRERPSVQSPPAPYRTGWIPLHPLPKKICHVFGRWFEGYVRDMAP